MEKTIVPLPQAKTEDHPSLPFTRRDPKETCFQCRFASREKKYDADLVGAVFCKWGPKTLTNLPQPNGSIIGIGAWPEVQSGQWCHRWEPRQSLADGNSSIMPS